MTDAAVRAAIVSYLDGASIAGIDRPWYQDEPWFLSAQAWNLSSNGGAGAVGYVHLDEHEETRATLGGLVGTMPAGQTFIHHSVSLLLQYQYLIPARLIAGAHEDDWVRPLDQIIDGVKAVLRADPTFGCGTAGPVWQAAQGFQGKPKLLQKRDLPTMTPDGSAVFSWNQIQFDVIEIITA